MEINFIHNILLFTAVLVIFLFWCQSQTRRFLQKPTRWIASLQQGISLKSKNVIKVEKIYDIYYSLNSI